VLIVGYPAIRGHVLGAAYTAVHGVALVASFACMLLAWHRRILPAPLEMRLLVSILCIDAVLFTGPYLPWDPNPFERWSIAQLGYSLMQIIMSVLLARGDHPLLLCNRALCCCIDPAAIRAPSTIVVAAMG
jgi:hypothetical protein